jgi:hypothetical protein
MVCKVLPYDLSNFFFHIVEAIGWGGRFRISKDLTNSAIYKPVGTYSPRKRI